MSQTVKQVQKLTKELRKAANASQRIVLPAPGSGGGPSQAQDPKVALRRMGL